MKTNLDIIVSNTDWLLKDLLRRGSLKKSSKSELSSLVGITQGNVDHIFPNIPISILKLQKNHLLLVEVLEQHNRSVRSWYVSKKLKPIV